MARGHFKLSAAKVRALQEPGRYGDGLGLWLHIGPTGGKSWVFRFMRDGRAREHGLGPLHTISLEQARKRAREARQKLQDNIDPIEDRLAERDARRAEGAESITFKAAAERFVGVYEAGWKNGKHKQQWRNTLATYAYPTLGSRPVSAIDGALITEAIADIWRTKPETASRVKQRIERIVQWVKDGMPLPAPGKSRRVKHHKALPWQELPEFMERLRDMDSVSARALEFTILTACRTGEIIGATWDEIDTTEKLWTIPAGRMKASKEHRVPLCARALEILAKLPRERGNHHVLVGASKGKGLSNMAMLECLKGMTGNGLTVHGFRSAFKDWAAESTHFPNIVSEAALAHTVGDKVEAAYRRGDLFKKRRQLMDAWCRYCASKPVAGASVTPLRQAAR